MRETLEREIKFDVRESFRIENLPGERLADRRFRSSYFDTADGRLMAAGVTLRRRVEDGDGLWQLKLPAPEGRLEVESPGPPEGPPGEIDDLLSAIRRGRPLVLLAELRTERSGVRLTQGGSAVEVTLDRVEVVRGEERTQPGRFSEVEAELAQGDPAHLAAVAAILRSRGAKEKDGRPKILQALGIGSPAAPGPAVLPDFPAGQHVAAAMRAQFDALVAKDAGTRLGSDPEDLHKFRVATRRSRAILRSARSLLDTEWSEPLRAELRWLGGALGPVRDLDVMIDYLEGEAARLGAADRTALDPVLDLLRARREEARLEMLAAMRSNRYQSLLDSVEEATTSPRVVDDSTSVVAIAAREHRKLHKAVRRLADHPADAELHALRIRGKRARYAAELARAARGAEAEAFIARAKDFQDVLGEHQDAVFAELELRALADRVGQIPTAVAIGELIERQRQRRRAARAGFSAAWASLRRAGRVAWGGAKP